MPSLIPLLLLLAASGPTTTPEESCLAERAPFHEVYFRTRSNGSRARAPLIATAQRLVETHSQTAPQCAGSVYENLAYLYILEEDYQASERVIRTFLRDVDSGATARSRIALRSQLGYVLGTLGQTMASSEAYYDAASRADDAPALFGIRALTRASTTARTMGDFDAAEAYLNSALDIVGDSIAASPDLVVVQGETLVTHALLLLERLDQGDAPSSGDSLIARLDDVSAEAMAILSSAEDKKGTLSIAVATHAMAAALAGDLDVALDRLQPAYGLARGRTPRLALNTAHWIGSRIRLLHGDHAGARRDAQAALREAIDKEAIAEHAIALTMLGHIAEDTGDWATAESWYQQAVNLREIHRDRHGLQDWSLSRFATMQAPYRGLVRARVALGDINGGLAALDQTRARHLRDLKAHIQLRETLDPATRRAVQMRIDSLGRIREAEAQPQSSTGSASLALARTQIQADIERLTGSLPAVGDTLNVSALRRQLGDRTLVAYAINEVNSIAFVVRPDTALAVHLGITLNVLAESVRDIGSMWSGAPPDPAFSLRALHRLYQQLVDPLRTHIDGDHVVIIPGAELAGVPFGMLTTGPAEDYATAPYLVRDWAISTELAAALLIDSPRANPDSDLDLLVLGRSQFDAGFTWNDERLVDLPDVQREAKQVGGYGAASRVLMDSEAGESVYYLLAPRSRILHMASHAEANAASPLNSRIALASGNGEDGTLYLHEILATPINADLVVLSGCSTADGGERSGEGIVGLQYGMRASGAAATLATLWEVADGTMSELTESFYRHLSEGETKDQALRSAQLAYLADHDGIEASPFFWAAPVLSGDSSSIPLSRRSGRWWMWALGIGALVVGLAWQLRLHTSDA